METELKEPERELVSPLGPCCKVVSPYLPHRRGLLVEKLVKLRFRATYWIWKRMIQRHCDGKLCWKRPLRFLDVGCGAGNFICCLESWFQNAGITGLDIDSELLRYAAERAGRANLLQGSAEELPFGNQLFDVVSCLQVIEHLSEAETFLNEANRVLKEDGLLLLATPNPEGLAAKMLGSRWRGIRKDHISLRPPEQWHKALQKSGFNIIDEGTTLFNGVPLIGRFPMSVSFQLFQSLFGWFHWRLGSSYMAIAKKDEKRTKEYD